MKKQFIRTSILTAIILVGAVAGVMAQHDVIAGGYGDADIHDKAVRNAAAVAIKQHSAHGRDKVRLVRIVKAERQVVAGLNYRLHMKVRDRRGRTRTVTAVVYQPLRRPMRLSKWKYGDWPDL